MSVRASEEFEGLRRVGRVVALALQAMAARLQPGITTGELDQIGAAVLKRHGARPAPPMCTGFPKATCISLNDEAAHGIPGRRVIQPGDLVNLDVSAELGGFFADTGASYPVPPVQQRTRELCRRTRRALRQAFQVMKPGRPINRTGRQIDREARRGGFNPIRNLCSHGVGRWLHEEPLQVPNYYDPLYRRRFGDGMVVAMETFLSMGSPWVEPAPNAWTLRTADGSLAAQYEHTVVITRRGPVIVTRL